MFKIILLLTLLSPLTWLSADNWQDTVRKARGQTVYFNAWGGAENINDYIRWAGKQVKKKYGISIKHVKVSNTADAVSRVLAEKTSGKNQGGSVDLIWINGENFRKMKVNKLLLNPWTNRLPNYALLDLYQKPTLSNDFQIEVNNQEAPWGMAQLVFMYDSAKLSRPPKSMQELKNLIDKNPGRFTYPALPDFYGLTFVKQALVELINDKEVLSRPVEEDKFQEQTLKLWAFLDSLHKKLWQQGRSFPKSIAEMKIMLNNGELFVSFSFNPNDATNAVKTGELPNTVRSYIHKEGTIGNTHFVAIPYNSSSKEGAQVFTNFLMSPKAQLRKVDPEYWGDSTVLNIHTLSKVVRQAFSSVDIGEASLKPSELAPTLREPHSTWSSRIEKEWLQRYSQ